MSSASRFLDVRRAGRSGVLLASVLLLFRSSPVAFAAEKTPARRGGPQISVTPNPADVPQGGQSGTENVNVFGGSGFSGTCQVVFGGLPANVSTSPNPVIQNWTPSDFSISTPFVFTAGLNAQVGIYSVSLNLVPTSGSCPSPGTGNVTVKVLPAPSFSADAQPNPVNLTAGGPAKPVTVNTFPQSGFGASITYSFQGFPSLITISPPSQTVNSPYSPVTFNFSADPSTPTTSIVGTLVATPSSGPVQTFSFTVNVQGTPAFKASASPNPVTLVPGGNTRTVSVNTQADPGFSSSITYSFGGFPAQISTGGSQTVNPPYGTLFFTFSASSSASPGTYNGQLIATPAFGPSQSYPYSVVVSTQPTFSSSISPNPVTIQAGGAAQNVQVFTSADPGFSQPITYSFSGFPAGVSTGGSQTVNPPYAPASFSFSAAASVSPGTYDGILTATTSGSTTQAMRVIVTAAPPPPPTPDIDASFGQTMVAICDVSTPVRDTIVLSPVNGYTGTPLLRFTQVPPSLSVSPLQPQAAPMPPGQTIAFTITATTSNPPAGPQTIVLNVSDPGKNINKNISMTVMFTVSTSFTPSVVPGTLKLDAGGAAQNVAANVTLSPCFPTPARFLITAGPPPGIGVSPASRNLDAPAAQPAPFAIRSFQGTSPGTYPVTFTFTAPGGQQRTVTVDVVVRERPTIPTFSFSADPNPLMATQGSSGIPVIVSTSADIELVSPITYSFSGLPSGITNDGPKTANKPYSPVTFLFDVAPGVATDTYTGQLTGKLPGGFSKSIAFIVIVTKTSPDIAVRLQQDVLSACAFGPPISDAVVLSPLNGYTGTPKLSYANVSDGLLLLPASPVSPPLPPAQTIPFTAQATTGAPGPLTALIVASDTALGISRSASLTVNVTLPGFNTSFVPPAVDLFPGGQGQKISISLAAANSCFRASKVTIEAVDVPAGIRVAPTSGMVFSPTFGPIDFTFTADPGTPPRTYLVSFLFTPDVGLARIVQAIVGVGQVPCRGPDPPTSPKIAPVGNPTGPVTATDYLELSWSPPAAGPLPTRYEYRINGGPRSSTVNTSAIVPPRGALDPIQLFVRAIACSPEELPGPEAASVVYSLAPPVANFDAPGSARVNTPVTFTDTSTPQATSWLWIWDDGTPPSTSQSQVHTFTTVGTHEVVLIASNGSGSSTKKKTILITAASARTDAVFAIRRFDSREPGLKRLSRVALRAGLRCELALSSVNAAMLNGSGSAAAEPIPVFVRFLDADGALVLERRLSVEPGREAVFELSAFAKGTFSIEVVSSGELTATLIQDQESDAVLDGPPARR